MAHKFPSEEWTTAYKDAVNASEGYRKHGKPWTFGAVAFVVKAYPALGLDEEQCMLLDVHEGECRSTKFGVGRATVESAPFIVVADYARWKSCLRGEIDPIKGMMEGKLKLEKGHLPTMLRFVESSRALVQAAQNVATDFLA
jgi:putative sterol carrier protein